MHHADARVHDDGQSAGLGSRGGVFAGDARLQPQRFGSDRHGLVRDGRGFLYASEDIDDIDFARHVRQ